MPYALFAKETRKRKQHVQQQEALRERKLPPSLRSVKQSSQAWNSVAIFFLCHIQQILNISQKSIHPP